MATVRVPGDKSIAHRALLLAALAAGESQLHNLPTGLDVRATKDALRALRIDVEDRDGETIIGGRAGTIPDRGPRIDCANSGTTMRLLAGLLATRDVVAILDGDASLRMRPMRRVTEPLASFGASLSTTAEGTAPIAIRGARHARGASLEVGVASAQVKSALLFAALGAHGRTELHGRLATRDHTERLFRFTGIPLEVSADRIVLDGPATPQRFALTIPGDISSAAFLMSAAAAVPGAHVTIEDVGLNPTRTAFLRALERFGAGVRTTILEEEPEPRGRIEIAGAALEAIAIGPDEAPDLIDELPLIGILGLFARGTTTVQGAAELRVKESDRIAAFAEAAQALGADVRTAPDGFAVRGGDRLHATTIHTRGDHRIAMAFTVAARIAQLDVHLDDTDCAAVSFPEFADALGAVA